MSSTQQQYRYPQQAHPLKHLLDSYTTSHPLRSPSPLPASSRVNPTLTQRLPPASSNPLFWTIPTWIAFVRFVTWKGLHIVWSLLSHFLWGPARKSWGYRMTFVSIQGSRQGRDAVQTICMYRKLMADCFGDAECSGSHQPCRYCPDPTAHLPPFPGTSSRRRSGHSSHFHRSTTYRRECRPRVSG